MPLLPPTEKQSRLIWLALTTLAVVALAGVVVGVIWGLGQVLNLLSPVLWPLAIAAVLACLLDPAVVWLQRRRLARSRAIVIVFAALACVAAGITAQVVPQLVRESSTLAANIPAYTAQAQERIQHWVERSQAWPRLHPFAATNAPADTPANATNSVAPQETAPDDPARSLAGSLHNQLISSAKDWLGQAAPGVGRWLLGLLGKFAGLGSVLMALILIPIYTFYFLREKDGIQGQWTRYLPLRDSRLKEEVIFVLSAVNQYLIAFFRGQVIVALVSGGLYTIGFLILGLDYALLLGFLAFILVIIPFVGVMILFVLALLLTAVQFQDFFHPALVAGVFAVVMALESFFYAPRIMGNRVHLHPAIILVALMTGMTLLGGLLGGLLAIPFAAALRVILSRYLWKKA